MSHEYMLDTDSVGLALRGEGSVGETIMECVPSQVCISALTVAELRHSADRRKSRKLHSLIDIFIKNLEVVPFDNDAAARYAKLIQRLATKTTQLSVFDTFIAAHALSLEAVLVTPNMRRFSKVPGLVVEDWT